MNYLTIQKIIYGVLIKKIGFFKRKNQIFKKQILKMKFVKPLADVSNIKPLVALYSLNKQKVVVKTWDYIWKDITYFQLRQEIVILKALNLLVGKNNQFKIRFPQVLSELNNKGQIGYVSEYIHGMTLFNLKADEKINHFSRILSFFQTLSNTASKPIIEKFPKISQIQNILTFPVYLLFTLVKDFKNLLMYLKLSFLFYLNYLSTIFSSEFVLSHRDIHSKNIIVRNNTLTILDPEVMVLAEKETDLAIVAKGGFAELRQELNNFLEDKFNNGYSEKKFLALAIFYSIQMMAISSSKSAEYKESYDFLTIFVASFIKNQSKTISVAERFMLFGLNLVDMVNKLFKVLNSKNNSVVLCYHSVSDGDWRFSVSKKQFLKQIQYLMEHYKLVSLDQLVNGKSIKNSVALTFDDGYMDNLTDVHKILKKYRIPATLFVLGNAAEANRSELDNQLPLLNTKQIKFLKKEGWEIGYHTKTHSDLRLLSQTELKEEILISKIKLEKSLGFKLKYFAYPRGIYSNNIIEVVKKAGYKNAFTVDGGAFKLQDSKFLNNRISMENLISQQQFEAMLSPLGIFWMSFYMGLLKLKEKIQFTLLSSISYINLRKRIGLEVNTIK